MDRRELLLREPGADAPGVDEAAVPPGRPGAARRSPSATPSGFVKPTTAKSPVRSSRTLIQSPERAAAVGRVGLLADDALEAELAGRREQLLALPLDVVGEAQRARRGAGGAAGGPCARSAAARAGRSPRRRAGRRRRGSRAARPRRARCRGAAGGARASGGVRSAAAPSRRARRPRRRGRRSRRGAPPTARAISGNVAVESIAVPVAEHGLAVLAAGEQPVAVVLELPEPAGPREGARRAARRASASTSAARTRRCGASRRSSSARISGRAARARGEVLEREAREDRLLRVGRLGPLASPSRRAP